MHFCINWFENKGNQAFRSTIYPFLSSSLSAFISFCSSFHLLSFFRRACFGCLFIYGKKKRKRSMPTMTLPLARIDDAFLGFGCTFRCSFIPFRLSDSISSACVICYSFFLCSCCCCVFCLRLFYNASTNRVIRPNSMMIQKEFTFAQNANLPAKIPGNCRILPLWKMADLKNIWNELSAYSGKDTTTTTTICTKIIQIKALVYGNTMLSIFPVNWKRRGKENEGERRQRERERERERLTPKWKRN